MNSNATSPIKLNITGIGLVVRIPDALLARTEYNRPRNLKLKGSNKSLDLEAIGSMITGADIGKESKPWFHVKNILPILIRNTVVHFYGFGNRLGLTLYHLSCKKDNPRSKASRYLSLHLWLEIDMVAHPLCEFDSGEDETIELETYRELHLPHYLNLRRLPRSRLSSLVSGSCTCCGGGKMTKISSYKQKLPDNFTRSNTAEWRINKAYADTASSEECIPSTL
ncbi:hypothetical protein MLD38_009970 [Melastoma candidum]|uniref:Uncharacterized protein n=1 Tax=Melastoma candidum TaxID=119954 RepID=A0ACB9R2D9_9MYRT|nr:hypothetical protein MLD38_009970 [Melastoma candidum]